MADQEPVDYKHTLYADNARRVKAIRLADVLFESGILADQAEKWGPLEWKQAAKDAGTNVPSDETKDIALKVLRYKEDQARKPKSDPFEGLPRA
jgi:hypothetical protein